MIDQDTVSSIENLHRLKSQGVITEEEFEKSKARLLFDSPKKKASVPITAPKAPIPLPAADDHVGWMILPIKRYLEFEGRSSRKEFWMYQLAYLVLLVGAVVIAAVLPPLGAALLILGFLGMFLPLLAVEVRRFHDQDRSGWLALMNLLPYVGPIIVFAFMLVPGTEGDNRFGEDPRTY